MPCPTELDAPFREICLQNAAALCFAKVFRYTVYTIHHKRVGCLTPTEKTTAGEGTSDQKYTSPDLRLCISVPSFLASLEQFSCLCLLLKKQLFFCSIDSSFCCFCFNSTLPSLSAVLLTEPWLQNPLLTLRKLSSRSKTR